VLHMVPYKDEETRYVSSSFPPSLPTFVFLCFVLHASLVHMTPSLPLSLPPSLPPPFRRFAIDRLVYKVFSKALNPLLLLNPSNLILPPFLPPSLLSGALLLIASFTKCSLKPYNLQRIRRLTSTLPPSLPPSFPPSLLQALCHRSSRLQSAL